MVWTRSKYQEEGKKLEKLPLLEHQRTKGDRKMSGGDKREWPYVPAKEEVESDRVDRIEKSVVKLRIDIDTRMAKLLQFMKNLAQQQPPIAAAIPPSTPVATIPLATTSGVGSNAPAKSSIVIQPLGTQNLIQ
eukprot:Gb_31740 [translate_table: standard]